MKATVPKVRVMVHMICRTPNLGSHRQLTGASMLEMKPRLALGAV